MTDVEVKKRAHLSHYYSNRGWSASENYLSAQLKKISINLTLNYIITACKSNYLTNIIKHVVLTEHELIKIPEYDITISSS